MKKLVVDLDDTITLADTNDYANVAPNLAVIETWTKGELYIAPLYNYLIKKKRTSIII